MVSSQAVGPCKRESEEETVGLHDGIPSVPKITDRRSKTSCIFLPAAGCRYGSGLSAACSYGYYWSSSLYTGSTSYAWYLYFNSDGYDMNFCSRYIGLSVRAVCQSQN